MITYLNSFLQVFDVSKWKLVIERDVLDKGPYQLVKKIPWFYYFLISSNFNMLLSFIFMINFSNSFSAGQ